MMEHNNEAGILVTREVIVQGPLDQQQYDAFKACLPTWRDVLIAKTLRSTGLRVMELLRLEGRHYDLSGPDDGRGGSMMSRGNARSRAPASTALLITVPLTLGLGVGWLRTSRA